MPQPEDLNSWAFFPLQVSVSGNWRISTAEAAMTST